MVIEGGAVQAVPPSHFQHATRLCEQVAWFHDVWTCSAYSRACPNCRTKKAADRL